MCIKKGGYVYQFPISFLKFSVTMVIVHFHMPRILSVSQDLGHSRSDSLP